MFQYFVQKFFFLPPFQETGGIKYIIDPVNPSIYLAVGAPVKTHLLSLCHQDEEGGEIPWIQGCLPQFFHHWLQVPGNLPLVPQQPVYPLLVRVFQCLQNQCGDFIPRETLQLPQFQFQVTAAPFQRAHQTGQRSSNKDAIHLLPDNFHGWLGSFSDTTHLFRGKPQRHPQHVREIIHHLLRTAWRLAFILHLQTIQEHINGILAFLPLPFQAFLHLFQQHAHLSDKMLLFLLQRLSRHIQKVDQHGLRSQVLLRLQPAGKFF